MFKRIIRAIRHRFIDKYLLAAKAKEAQSKMITLSERSPLMVNIETTTICNARCVFCAYPKLDRAKDIMTLEIFEKTCSEVNAVGGYLGFSPIMSDPLVDPLLFKRLEIASKYHRVRLHMFTNGIRLIKLSDEQLESLLDQLEYINVSIGGLDPAAYRTMFGVDKFDDVIAGLYRFAALKKKLRSKCKLILHIRTNDRNGILRHHELRKLRTAGFKCEDVLDTFSNWSGVVKKEHIPTGASLLEIDNSDRKSPCLIPMTQAMILPDGRVAGCACMDGAGSVVVGDTKSEPLSDIWTGQKAKDFRASFERGDVHHICKSCAYYTDANKFFANPRYADFKLGDNMWHAVQ